MGFRTLSLRLCRRLERRFGNAAMRLENQDEPLASFYRYFAGWSQPAWRIGMYYPVLLIAMLLKSRLVSVPDTRGSDEADDSRPSRSSRMSLLLCHKHHPFKDRRLTPHLIR